MHVLTREQGTFELALLSAEYVQERLCEVLVPVCRIVTGA